MFHAAAAELGDPRARRRPRPASEGADPGANVPDLPNSKLIYLSAALAAGRIGHRGAGRGEIALHGPHGNS